jgi:hypothetical protein
MCGVVWFFFVEKIRKERRVRGKQRKRTERIGKEEKKNKRSKEARTTIERLSLHLTRSFCK